MTEREKKKRKRRKTKIKRKRALGLHCPSPPRAGPAGDNEGVCTS
jgi:hypothetical protein